MSKVVLITGGSRGIGRATARLAGSHGWSVAVNFVANAEAANRTVDEVEAAGGRAIAVRGDVAKETDVIAMFEATEKALGPLYGLVNNAGIVAPTMPLAEMSAERLRRMFDVNLYGAYLCAREAARRLGKRRRGVIVNVSSTASRRGSPFEWVDYAGCKGALDTMTIGLAQELGPEGVRVNAVRPGLTDTEIHASAGRPNRANEMGARTPMKRAGTADEVANAIVWLLSDRASYVNGALLDVSGGF